RNGARASQRGDATESPADTTLRLLKEGRTFEEIAHIRERRLNTVIDLVAAMVERGLIEFDENWIAPPRQALIQEAIARLGIEKMKPIKDALPEDVTYGEIRLMVSRFKRSGKSS